VTLCPPAPAHFIDDPEPIFYKPTAMPVDTSGYREGEEPHGYISFDDYQSSMSVHKRSEGKKTVPDWLLKDNGNMLREVLLRMVENRAGYWEPQPGTQSERLERAQKRCLERRARKIEVLEGLCNRYVEAKCSGDLATAKMLSGAIESLDAEIISLTYPGALVAGVLYFSWRCGMNSVSVSQVMQGRVKPTNCRQILHRARRIAEVIEGKRPPRVKPTGRRKQAAPVTPAPVEAQPEIDRSTRWSAESLASFRRRKSAAK